MVSLSFWIPRKHREPLINDIMKDCHELRILNKSEFRIIVQVLWQFTIGTIFLCLALLLFPFKRKGSNKIELEVRHVSDGLLLCNELVSETGSDFIKAHKVHAGLLGLYVCEMKTRQLAYAAALLTDKADEEASILANLQSIKKSLEKYVPESKQDTNAWAKEDIKEASKKLDNLLRDFEPYLKEPFDIEEFKKLGDICRKDLYAALKDVKVKIREYIQHLTVMKADTHLAEKKAEELCEANRKAIVLLFLNRFARYEDRRVRQKLKTRD